MILEIGLQTVLVEFDQQVVGVLFYPKNVLMHALNVIKPVRILVTAMEAFGRGKKSLTRVYH